MPLRAQCVLGHSLLSGLLVWSAPGYGLGLPTASSYVNAVSFIPSGKRPACATSIGAVSSSGSGAMEDGLSAAVPYENGVWTELDHLSHSKIVNSPSGVVPTWEASFLEKTRMVYRCGSVSDGLVFSTYCVTYCRANWSAPSINV